MLNLFLRGLLMDESGGDAGGDTGGGDTGGGGGTGGNAGGGTETALATTDTGAEESTALTVQDPAEVSTDETDLEPYQPLRDGKPSRTTAAAIALIKQSHPQVAKAIPRALAMEARIRSMVPQGVNPFDEFKRLQRVEKDLGGQRGIADIRKELAEIEELDQLYARSDPRMLDIMTSTPDGERAFSKMAPFIPGKLKKLPGGPAAIISMAPAIYDLHRELAPRSYNRYMSSTILGDLMHADVDLHFRRLASLIPADNEIGKQSVAAIQAYMDRLNGLTKLEPEAMPAETNTGTDTGREELTRERQELANEKRAMVLQGWKNASDQAKDKLFQSAWAELSKGKKISPVDREDIEARFWLRLPKAMAQVPGFDQSLKEFWESEDRDGYLRYLQGLHAQHVPRVLKAEIVRRFPQAAGTQAAVTQATPGTQRGALDSGFKRVASAPVMNSVNVRLTSTDMWKQGKAVLKSGEKVQWA